MILATTMHLSPAKETKGCYRFDAAVEDQGKVPTIYIRKAVFGGATPPDRVQLILNPLP